MLFIAAAALTAGSVTVAVIAPLNLLLAVALGPVAGTGAAVLATVLVARRRGEDEQDGADSDEETDRMVASLREMGRQAAGPSGSPIAGPTRSRVA
ncbi:hypothetical protein [Methylobacterium haplocladii]|uniref:Uncharacterized protein n=1 Tax=Methylobacterium haplocladii TaxID=1176176 RepID=A0A512IVK0_9HYPH|nr:hypothetical protein [Methylobacterium haplocladii]GEP01748.1 hypothetical protein MHA02_41350 [Methylobacterium haplocladii]GJD86005.1 hypothetical protein HPGCJGGD_3900 [Methylobacterium haplocladii]GLS59717.1 hypothetical protein GCM10007887_23880 [Methylobacterium haplocladii]